MTSEIQQDRYSKIVRRVGGLIGPGSKVSEVITELFPMIDVERVPGELLALGGTTIAQGGHQVAAAAGFFGAVQLFNPVGSNKIVTITQVRMASISVNSFFRISLTDTALGGASNVELARDSRFAAPEQPAAQVRFRNDATLVTPTTQIRGTINVDTELKDENSVAVLSPGFGYDVGTNAANNTLLVNFWWRERAAEASELSL